MKKTAALLHKYKLQSYAGIKARLAGNIQQALKHEKTALLYAHEIYELTGEEPDEITQFDMKKNPSRKKIPFASAKGRDKAYACCA